MAESTKAPAFCKASYRAEQIPGLVIVTARGSHRTGGYRVWFEQSPIRIFPPELNLFHERPEVGTGAITPFSVSHFFSASDPVERVVVHDRDGRREVPVEQVPDVEAPCDGDSDEDSEDQEAVYSQVHEADDIPPEEQTRNVGDDIDADREDQEDDRRMAGVEMEVAAAIQWRVAKSLLALRDQVNRKAPHRDKANDGTIGDAAHASRSSDHNPWVTDGNIGVVTAMDITHDPAHGCDANDIAEAIRGSQDSRVKYVIWNRRIANPLPLDGQPPWAWRPYNGANPHDHHVHISVKPEKASYDSITNWAV
ncbi:MAG TPA: hypothetical protein VHC97_20430 [Thermoanaerobaculia bacterium]|jgi:hypothetical protein|nr:hypothetical protein [Thermoanaerobaculia bacterium]